MRTLELFCGTKSFSKVAEERGHSTFTVDNQSRFNPTLCKDIMDILPSELPQDIDVLWCSPPCTFFSVSSIGKHWNRDHTPKTPQAELGVKIIKKMMSLIEEINPTYVFIENPRGKLRKLDLIPFNRNTITYCQYGDTRMKPTDIWHTCPQWTPRRMCHNGDDCHEKAPRGSKTGTQGLKGAEERGVIPPTLFHELFDIIENGN